MKSDVNSAVCGENHVKSKRVCIFEGLCKYPYTAYSKVSQPKECWAPPLRFAMEDPARKEYTL